MPREPTIGIIAAPIGEGMNLFMTLCASSRPAIRQQRSGLKDQYPCQRHAPQHPSFEAWMRMNHAMPAVAISVIPMESVASACSTIPYACREQPYREHPAAQVPSVTGSGEQWRV